MIRNVLAAVDWPLWVGFLAGLYLLIRGVVLIVIGRTIWGIAQIAGTLVFFGTWTLWIVYGYHWAQYAVVVAVLLLLVPLFFYPRSVMKQTDKPPLPPEDSL